LDSSQHLSFVGGTDADVAGDELVVVLGLRQKLGVWHGGLVNHLPWKLSQGRSNK
jgi:hypothetical protein